MIDILEYIPVGKKNAISRECLRQMTNLNDRDMRKLISVARRTTPILNSQDGIGYYIPADDEKSEVEAFIKQESKRARTIFYNLKGARKWLKEVDKQEQI